MSRSVAILQSNYIPWKGYFDIIGSVDLFVFYDDRQFTKNDWRNRNQIVTQHGVKWLTIPCGGVKGRLICDVELNDSRWQKKHWSSISQAYAKAPFFPDYRPFFEDVYLGRTWTHLWELNQFLIRHIAREFLGFRTAFDDSREHALRGDKGARVMELLASIGGVTEYVSGPSARDYLDPSPFAAQGMQLTWMDYEGYPEYDQGHAPFEHQVSILDLLFRTGPEATSYMKCGGHDS